MLTWPLAGFFIESKKETGLNWRTFGLDDRVSVYEGTFNNPQNLSFRFFQTLCRSSGPLHCARLVLGPCQWCVGGVADWAGSEQGSPGSRDSREEPEGFCPSEGNFFCFNVAVTWLELNKVLFEIGREEEAGVILGGWKRLPTCTHTHYNHCFCVNYRISGGCVQWSWGLKSTDARTLDIKPLSLAFFPLPTSFIHIYIITITTSLLLHTVPNLLHLTLTTISKVLHEGLMLQASFWIFVWISNNQFSGTNANSAHEVNNQNENECLCSTKKMEFKLPADHSQLCYNVAYMFS